MIAEALQDRIDGHLLYAQRQARVISVEPESALEERLEVAMPNKAISDMYKQCSYPMKDNAIAMSDCCRGHAMSAVLDGGFWYWRCRRHLGLIEGDQEGDVRFAMEVEE